MTEELWLSGDQWADMLRHIRNRPGRLLGQRFRILAIDALLAKGMDGCDLLDAEALALRDMPAPSCGPADFCFHLAGHDPFLVAYSTLWGWSASECDRFMADLVRESFWDPFCEPPSFPITRDILSLAQASFDHPGFGGAADPIRLSVLADAIQDEGCHDNELIRHLRGLEPCRWCLGRRWGSPRLLGCPVCKDSGHTPIARHGRGCWALWLIRFGA